MQMELSDNRLIQCMAVIDIDPNLTHFKPIQQKWISSIQLFSQIPKETKQGSKLLNVSIGLYLVINFCEKNRLPIYEIDFLAQPSADWIQIKMPYNLMDRFADSYLCYKTQQLDLLEPLGDIEVINTQKKNHLGFDKQVVNVPNGYKVVSNPIFHNFLIYKRMKSRLQQTFKPIILQHYPGSTEINLGLIPLFCFPQGIKLARQLKGFITFSFILTQQTGDRLYITYLTFKQLLNENLKAKLNVKIPDKIYYDKGLCVISKYKFSDQLSECLQHLYRLSMSKNDQPFHKVAANFVNQMKIPVQIKTHGFSYSYNGCNINFDYDPILQSVSGKCLYCIFKFLPIEQILTVFKALLYQRQVIFVSQSKTILGFAMQAFMSLVFPFRWQNVIIPIVPITMRQYLTAPVPFLAGITTTQMIDTSVESETVIVLLDSGKVMNDQDMPPLPQKLAKQLIKRLQTFQIYEPQEVRQYLQNPENTYMFKMMQVQNPDFQPIAIRQAFLQFFLTLMKNYKKYWKSKFFKNIQQTFAFQSNQPPLINEMFKIQDFLSDLGMNKVASFGYKFTQGTIFTAYLQRRYRNNGDLVANFFDECLQRKKSKKNEISFLTSQSKQRYIVSKHPQPQKQRMYYIYQRFPSILPQPTSKQILDQQIQLQLQQEQIFTETQFLEFLSEEKQLSYGFLQAVNVNQYKEEDFAYLSLLTNKYRRVYLQHKTLQYQHKTQQYQQKNQHQQKKLIYIFKDIYELQNVEIQKLFNQWPKFNKSSLQLVCLQKDKYFKLKMEKKLQKQNNEQILSIWQGQCLQMIIKGSIKIIISSSCEQNQVSQLRTLISNNLSLTSSSLGKGFYQHSICLSFPSYRIRSFFNQIFKYQPQQIFSFIYTNIKNGNDNCWTIETLFELRQYIDKLADIHQKEKFSTQDKSHQIIASSRILDQD